MTKVKRLGLSNVCYIKLNGYTFAIVYSSKCVLIRFNETDVSIIDESIRKVHGNILGISNGWMFDLQYQKELNAYNFFVNLFMNL